MRSVLASLAAAPLLALPACGDSPAPEGDLDAETPDVAAAHPGAGPGAEGVRARAELRGTQDNRVAGTVFFEPAAGGGVIVKAELTGLPEGPHAYHVHLYGDCSAPDATSAGTHFDFESSSEHPREDVQRITGNLGVLNASASGKASHEGRIERARLSGPNSIVGRAVVVHARGNDPSQPPIGDAGPRLACGVIGIADRSS